MQVLGDLIRLPEEARIPVPWWHRSPLGFLSNTPVFVALMAPNRNLERPRPVGDLIVTVLDPNKWSKMVRVNCRAKDAPGILKKKLEAVFPFNVALAEAVTVDSGERHDVTLICEPWEGGDLEQEPAQIIQDKFTELGYTDTTIAVFNEFHKEILWSKLVQTSLGWVNDVSYREEIARLYGHDDISQVDLTKAVVSCDTNQRIVRYVFPYHGALTVRVQHADHPGVLSQITDALLQSGVNLLSELLRRGGVSRGNALLLAACEPFEGRGGDGLADRIRKNVGGLPQSCRCELSISFGRPGERTTELRRDYQRLINVPSMLHDAIDGLRASSHKRRDAARPAVFFHWSAAKSSTENVAYCQHLRSFLGKYVHVVEPIITPEDAAPKAILDSSKMWHASAAVIVIHGKMENVSVKQMLATSRMLGFFQGQNKDVLLLTSGEYGGAFESWARENGMTSFAVDFSNSNSVESTAKRWIDVQRRKILSG